MSWFLRALVGTVLLASVGANAQEVTLTARARVLQDQHKESSHAENVVVWLTAVDGKPGARPPSQNLRLTQHNKSFEPHLLVVPVGAVVQFPNRDPFFHNVFSLFEGKRFDLGLYEAGSTRNVSFDRPGIAYIFCNIHAEMGAVVIALDTPYFAISNHKGEIVISHVPVGRYVMKVWYETAEPPSLDAMTREITVSETSTTLGLLQISAAPAASAHKNKYGMDYEPPAPNDPAYSHQ
jgi:plastocyanin